MNHPPRTAPATLGGCATLACIWEATAPKPGNVYRGADFEDMTYVDFLTSAAVVGPVIDRCGELGLGATLLAACTATRDAVGVNTNLGTLLLIAPLAIAAQRHQPAGDVDARCASAQHVARQATADDASRVYEAIRVAMPGGLGEVGEGDVARAPVHTIVDAMRLAAGRDLVARQYVNGFAEVAQTARKIETAIDAGESLSEAIVLAYLRLIAQHGDSLVQRKLGEQAAAEVLRYAAEVLKARQQGPEAYRTARQDFDFWLRADGHRRNPGTSADLIAAALFVLLAENRLSWPMRFYP